MCGFVGYVGRVDNTLLSEMTASIAHRGPDNEMLWVDYESEPPVSIGFRRLIVVDAEGGSQPMLTPDESHLIVYNGEIYNHRELRLELEALGCRFRTNHSDTEVILAGYREWGLDVVKRLNGMFSFVIYDRGKNRLVLGRDPFGKKPMFYAHVSSGFVFGSELTPVMLHPEVSGRISIKSIARYLAIGHVPAPDSMYENVKKQPAGSILTYNIWSRDISEIKYWSYRIRPGNQPFGSEDDWADQVGDLIKLSVKRRLEADVPIGFLLSGGLDSSAIVGVAASYLAEERMQTFSASFQNSSFDESYFSSSVARHFGTVHRTSPVTLELVQESLPKLYSLLDEPIADSSLLATHLICKFAREHVTVVLSGDGGDELFAGYDPFSALKLAKFSNRFIPDFMGETLKWLAEAWSISENNMGLDFKLRRGLRGLGRDPELWNPLWLAPATPNQISQLTGQKFGEEELYEDVIKLWNECESDDLIDRSLEFYANFYLEGLLTKIDRASMLCGLEVRSPFLDLDLANFVLRLPAHTKYGQGKGKRILRRAVSDLLPKPIINRPKKGFGVPILGWLRQLQMPNLNNVAGLGLDPEVFTKLWTEHARRDRDHRGVLWACLALDLSLKSR